MSSEAPSPSSDREAGDDAAPHETGSPVGQPVLAAVLALAWPGAGHAYLRRWRRGLFFLGVVVSTLLVGVLLGGKLHVGFGGPLLESLKTLGCAGLGLVFLLLRTVGYQGDPMAVGFDYGSAFVVTAGVMNLLLVLDAWDISTGRKP